MVIGTSYGLARPSSMRLLTGECSLATSHELGIVCTVRPELGDDMFAFMLLVNVD